MAGKNKKETTSQNRARVVDAFVKHLSADRVPGEVIAVYKALGDGCYCAFAAGKMVAQRMELEGDIKADQVFEIAMEFAKIMAMKITVAPQPSQLMKPQAGGARGVMNMDTVFSRN